MMNVRQPSAPLHGLILILLSMCVVITGQVVTMHAALTLKIAARAGTSTDSSRTRMRRRQSLGGALMLLGLGAMLVLCTAYNYWPGVTPHYRRARIARPAAVRSPFSELTLVPAWVFVMVTGPVIAMAGGAGGYALRRLRAEARRALDLRQLLRMVRWVTLTALAIVPLPYALLFGLMWLEGATAENLLDDPPRWFFPAFLVYFLSFAIPPAMFMLHGSRRTWRSWVRRL